MVREVRLRLLIPRRESWLASTGTRSTDPIRPPADGSEVVPIRIYTLASLVGGGIGSSLFVLLWLGSTPVCRWLRLSFSTMFSEETSGLSLR